MQSATNHYQQLQQDQLRERFVRKYLHVVAEEISNLSVESPFELNLENAQSAGVIGILNAATGVSGPGGADQTPVARRGVRTALLEQIRANDQIWDPSRELLEQIGKVVNDDPACVSVQAIANATRLPPNRICDALAVMRLINGPLECFRFSMDDPVDASAAVDESALQTARRIASEIEQLPAEERLVLSLYHKEKLSASEILRVTRLTPVQFRHALAVAEFALRQHIMRLTAPTEG